MMSFNTGVSILFLLGVMPLFDAVIHVFGTLGIGGFSVKAGGLGHYDSSFIEWTTLVLMFLFGINSIIIILLESEASASINGWSIGNKSHSVKYNRVRLFFRR